MDETALIRAACQEDIESFNQLVLTCQDLVFGQASWTLEDRASTEAITQAASVRADHCQTLPGGCLIGL